MVLIYAKNNNAMQASQMTHAIRSFQFCECRRASKIHKNLSIHHKHFNIIYVVWMAISMRVMAKIIGTYVSSFRFCRGNLLS